jgi:hypothetical protein
MPSCGRRQTDATVLLATTATAATTPATTRGTGRATPAVSTESATPTATATAATAASRRTALARDVHRDRTTIERRPVEGLNGTLSLFVGSKLDEAKPTGLTRGSVDHHASRGYLAELGEGLLQLLVHRRVRQVAHIQPVSHYYFISIAWHRIRSDSKVVSVP